MLEKECKIHTTVVRGKNSSNYIQCIKTLRAIIPMDLRSAKEAIDIMCDGVPYTCWLTPEQITDFRLNGFTVIPTIKEESLPESLFSLDEPKVISFNAGELKITTHEMSFKVFLSEKEKNILINQLTFIGD
jgi:hypothetical protein